MKFAIYAFKIFLVQKLGPLKQSRLSLLIPFFLLKANHRACYGKEKVFSRFTCNCNLLTIYRRELKKWPIVPLTHVLLHIFCSIIVTTVQYLSPALHKNFTDADFDFKVCDFD